MSHRVRLISFFGLLVAGLAVGGWLLEGPAAESPIAATAGGGAPDPPDASERGKWRRARDPAPSGQAEIDAAATVLLANPYLQGYRSARNRAPISRHDPERAAAGLNLYVSGHAAEALLMEMDGQVVHRWRYDLERVWPDFYDQHPIVAPRLEYWRRAELLPDGDLLAIFEGLGVIRLDADSKLRWAYRGGAHHDLFVSGETVTVLDRRTAVMPQGDPETVVLEDLVTVLDIEDGTVVRQVSILAALERSSYRELVRGLEREGDILHTNTIERLEVSGLTESLSGVQPGSWLLSLHRLDALAVLDPDSETVVWALTGSWRRQHQPTVVAGGRLMLFDNLGLGDRSQVIEVDPRTREVGWRYPVDAAPDQLFSKTLGSCQRLPNGNTLITESENGRAIEVTPAGEIVWQFDSPHRAGPNRELVATLFEVVRLGSRPDWVDGRRGAAGVDATATNQRRIPATGATDDR